MSIYFIYSLTLAVALFVAFFAFDDLFIDFVALIKNLKPQKLSLDEVALMHNLPQKKFAIMIANWHEEEILERMIVGNIGRIDYLNYDFFLGVYPNDEATLNMALRLKERYSRIQVVINTQEGPTSKGQMLNQIVSAIKAIEISQRKIYDVFLLHDSEDIIHTMALKLLNYRMEKNDFVQIPVFSLPTPALDLTRGTYIDEFTESHTKDMLVRSHLKGGVPSAGVGTAMSRYFVADMIELQKGPLLKQETLTEDYHLGLMAHRLGYKSEFACYYIQKKKSKDFVATREFFPARVATSVRQKTRWTLGISLQGYDNLKWGKTLTENYFLWRDRRGLINGPLLLLGYGLFVSNCLYYIIQNHWPDYILDSELLKALFLFNFSCMLFKIFQRYRLVISLNGYALALMIPVRWFLANYINTMASIKAVQNYRTAIKTGLEPKWSKTTHELPVNFGLEPFTILENEMVMQPSLQVEFIEPALKADSTTNTLNEQERMANVQ